MTEAHTCARSIILAPQHGTGDRLGFRQLGLVVSMPSKPLIGFPPRTAATKTSILVTVRSVASGHRSRPVLYLIALFDCIPDSTCGRDDFWPRCILRDLAVGRSSAHPVHEVGKQCAQPGEERQFTSADQHIANQILWIRDVEVIQNIGDRFVKRKPLVGSRSFGLCPHRLLKVRIAEIRRSCVEGSISFPGMSRASRLEPGRPVDPVGEGREGSPEEGRRGGAPTH